MNLCTSARAASISQREVGVHCASFSDALHSALREDPDVILVGELRDLETMSIAVTAAEMGILVMGTLHTNGAAQTVDRIVNSFPSDKQGHIRTMLSTSLRGVISQQLMPSSPASPGAWLRWRSWSIRRRLPTSSARANSISWKPLCRAAPRWACRPWTMRSWRTCRRGQGLRRPGLPAGQQ